jgi:hypothetical protein
MSDVLLNSCGLPLLSSERMEQYRQEANERREAEERERQARKAREAEGRQRAASK